MGGSEKGRRQGRGQDGRGQARRKGQGQRVEKMVVRGTRGKGVGGMAAGSGVGHCLGSSVLRSCVLWWTTTTRSCGPRQQPSRTTTTTTTTMVSRGFVFEPGQNVVSFKGGLGFLRCHCFW